MERGFQGPRELRSPVSYSPEVLEALFSNQGVLPFLKMTKMLLFFAAMTLGHLIVGSPPQSPSSSPRWQSLLDLSRGPTERKATDEETTLARHCVVGERPCWPIETSSLALPRHLPLLARLLPASRLPNDSGASFPPKAEGPRFQPIMIWHKDQFDSQSFCELDIRPDATGGWDLRTAAMVDYPYRAVRL